jgi:hypothetical protein
MQFCMEGEYVLAVREVLSLGRVAQEELSSLGRMILCFRGGYLWVAWRGRSEALAFSITSIRW